MRLAGHLVVAMSLGLFASAGWGQARAVSSGQEPAAIDPMYTQPAASLTPQQIAGMQKLGADWPQLGRYRADNEKLGSPAPGEKRVVFYGDSITDAWGRRGDETKFFPGKAYVNRGISGQTTAQMLVRFRQDVVDLKPKVVVILAGTNDIAGNTGLSSLKMIEDNFESMDEIAKANHIKVILASVLAVTDYPWRRGLHPAEKVRELNAWLKSYAAKRGDVYLDYYAAMSNAEGGLDAKLASDGVHPTPAGYAIMAPLAEKAIAQALPK
jgi:lysophospholipase L1-like esterase